MKSKNLYIKSVRLVENGKFCVGTKGSKEMVYPSFMTGGSWNRIYATGQNIKRNIIEAMGLDEFNEKNGINNKIEVRYKLDGKGKKKNVKEHILVSSCDAHDSKLLLGGYMLADKAADKIKRSSPFSIGGFHPLHPELASTTVTDMVFSNKDSTIILEDGQDEYVEEEAIQKLIDMGQEDSVAKLTRTKFNPDSIKKANGIYNNIVEINLERLFRVFYDPFESEIKKEDLERFRTNGMWIEEKENVFRLKDKHILEIVDLIVHGLISFKFGTNQSVSLTALHPLAVAISNDASELGEMIGVEYDGQKIIPYVDNLNGGLFLHRGIGALKIQRPEGAQGIKEAKQHLKTKILDYYGIHQS